MQVAVVTGSSKNDLILARNGFLTYATTYATMRNLNKSENIESVATRENLPISIKQLDVTSMKLSAAQGITTIFPIIVGCTLQ